MAHVDEKEALRQQLENLLGKSVVLNGAHGLLMDGRLSARPDASGYFVWQVSSGEVGGGFWVFRASEVHTVEANTITLYI